MSYLSRELVFLILQFLDEEKFKEAARKLECESGFYFNMKYLDEKIMAGDWDEAERYLNGFTKLEDNRFSMKIFFEIRKQKYLEALDSQDNGKALDILLKDLQVFSQFNDDLFKQMTLLLTLDDFRENEQLSKYGDLKSARGAMMAELKKLIEANPLFREKLAFPALRASRLRTLINQSLNWQHQLCTNARPNPDIKTLYTDHTCSPLNGPQLPPPVTIPVTAVPRPNYVPFGAHSMLFPTPPTVPTSVNALASWMSNVNPSPMVQSAVSTPSPSPVTANQVAVLNHPRPSVNTSGLMDYQVGNADHPVKRARTAQSIDDIMYPAAQLDELPRNLVCTMHQGSMVTSMDFHPLCQTLLIVGCSTGEIALWDVAKQEKLVSKLFDMWEKSACSVLRQAAVANDSSISVRRIAWSPDGTKIGVAFSKHVVHLYAYQGSSDLQQHLEIDAHIGSVNDLAFANPKNQFCVVTCGDDKLVKVWDLNGRKLYTFEGHEAPVYSVCPHKKDTVEFIFSTAFDGIIKAWLYGDVGSRVDYDAPGRWCTKMLYSDDGNRLFSCGTSKDGDSFLVEWNEAEGTIKRKYAGFRRKSSGVVQFDSTRNRFLAAGEDNQIKFWDMDYNIVLSSTDAEGQLPSLPQLKFNNEGNLLAVTTVDNGFKILANAAGQKLIWPPEVSQYGSSHPARDAKNSVDPAGSSILRPQILEGMGEKAKPWKLTEIVNPTQCRELTMPDSTDIASKVVRLLYTNSGVGVLALGSNGVLRLWKWMRTEQNPNRKATTRIVPQFWQPNCGLIMKNDVPKNSEAVPCVAISKNDSYVMSAYGGHVSLFNMMNFKVMTTFMSSTPPSTFLAFDPHDNNIVAVGLIDSSIHIYNVRMDEVKVELKSHQKWITGLAFSSHLKILVSSGADAQLCFWSTDTWEKKKSTPIQLPVGKQPAGETRIQFHPDQVHLLVCHETQLATYDASKMEFICQWVPQDVLPASLCSATYSCNGNLVYASFTDGNIGVFDTDTFTLRCRIAPSSYISQTQTCANSHTPRPLVIAAHPHEPNQFSVGLSDGSVKVIEPLETEDGWGVAAQVDSGVLNDKGTASASNTPNP